MKQPKTTGLEWLLYSVAAFNGSGYADRSSAKAFVESYIHYKKWKNKPEQAKLAKKYRWAAENLAKTFIGRAYNGRQPSERAKAKFEAYRVYLKT